MATQLKSVEGEIDARDQIGGLSAALVKAQVELHAPTKNREVTVKSDKGSYKFQYATLDGIVEGVLRPVLPKFGLWFVQFAADGKMVTRIIHTSGEYLDCGVPMPQIPAAPQQAGSVLSYFKRYSLCAAFALVAEEDDDANIAEGNHYSAKGGNSAPPAGKITDAQRDELLALAEKAGVTTEQFCTVYKIGSVADLPAANFARAKNSLNLSIGGAANA